MEVQWFGLHASAAESMDSILDLGNEIPTCHMAQPPPPPPPPRLVGAAAGALTLLLLFLSHAACYQRGHGTPNGYWRVELGCMCVFKFQFLDME